MAQSRVQRALGIFGIGFALLLGSLVFFTVNTALPAIQEQFSAKVSQLQWIITGVGISLAAFEVTMGRLADRYGRRLVFCLGQILFAISCLICGWAPQIIWLIIGRVVQGVSLAVILSVSMGLMVHQFPAAEKGKAVGLWGAILGIGMALGPVVGGVIIEFISWRWIFFLNIPALVLSGLISWFFVKESKDETHQAGLDWGGLSLLIVAIATIILAVVEGPSWGWTSGATLGCFAIGIIATVGLVLVERTVNYPILPRGVFKNRIFVAGLFNNFMLVFAWWAIFFLMPLYLNNILGMSTVVMGLMLGVMSIPFAIASTAIGRIATHTGPKMWVIIGWILWIVGIVGAAFFSLDTPLWYTIVTLALLGFSLGVIWPPATTFTFSTLPQRMASTAAGVLATAQELGGTIGVAVVGVLFRGLDQGVVFAGLRKANVVLTDREAATVRGYLSDPQAIGQYLKHLGDKGVEKLVPLFQKGFLAGFNGAMWLLVAIAVVMLLVAIFWMKGGKQEVVHAEDR